MLDGMKILFWVFLLLIVFWLVRKLRKPERKDNPHEERPVERMVSCAHCGVNLPISESIEATGRFYCSRDHLRIAEVNKTADR